ncbi:hypothetical protein [Alkalibacillus haloalkaliphilus]|uniref:hypothetical protein n=1 Tax=Alkalibacillus haloalkaliphilus TaxID=94136 RepID=UPI002936857A|nr:hypothetical protein [Alkalibacillus haloalkaliphilus]MDV2581374.1 hypothetical protein [Alkalibacillus haloalkaliphilus]
MTYEEYWNRIFELSQELSQVLDQYWHEHSSWDSWQFWVNIVLLIAPLIILYFAIDRTRMFEILFFGLLVHMLWNYSSNYLESQVMFRHLYFITTMLPSAFTMVASALPVAFMLLYQYCTNNGKNFYVWVIGLSVLFAFGFAPLEVVFGITHMGGGFHYVYLFFIDIAIAFISYWFVKALIKSRDRAIKNS